MKRILFISLISFAIFINPLKANKVDIETARNVAINVYLEKSIQINSEVSTDYFKILRSYTQKHNGNNVFYAFDMNEGGFVIVSGDDSYTPVIGYSFEGHFPTPEEGNYNFNSCMKSYSEMLDYSIKNEIPGTEDSKVAWKHYTLENFTTNSNENREGDVAPLLTALWNQDFPYNYYSPEDDDGPGNHAYAGCVATAMSMVMYYYRYPSVGQGAHSYYCNGYGTQSADFGETEYKYDEMNDEIKSYNPFQVALLQQHCGIAMEMNFGGDGSSASSGWVPNRVESYFGYNDAVYLQKEDYTLSTWYAMIQEHLTENKLIYYRGSSEDGGHAFIIDGYQAEYDYHFNFGWSGSGNGYYTLSDVNGFNGGNAGIFNFVPSDPDYPYLADGDKILKTASGSFTDGSGPLYEYSTGIDASWLIDPTQYGDSIENVTLFFTELDLHPSDPITIYDGSNEESPIIGTYSGNEIPESITSTGNKLFVTFATDIADNAKGFKAEYTSKYHKFCNSLITFSEPTDTITDGSGIYNYQNSASCMWNTNFANGESVTLQFLELDTEEGKDFVNIYEGNSLVTKVSGNEIPDPITINGGLLFITFTSNASSNSGGWKAVYTTDFVGIDDIDDSNKIFAAPNPSNGNFTLNLNADNNSDYNRIEIYSIDGKKVYSRKINFNQANNSVNIEMAKTRKGIYFLKVLGNKKSKTLKLAIE